MLKKLFNNKSKIKHPRPKIFSFRNGLKTLPERLTQILGEKIRTGARVKNIKPLKKSGSLYEVTVEIDGTTTVIKANTVIISTPSHQTAKLIEPISSKAGNHLKTIDYAPMAVVALG